MPRTIPRRAAKRVTEINRYTKQALMLASDVLLLSIAAWAAYSLRLGQGFSPNQAQWILIIAAPITAIPIFVQLGLYRSVIRYVGEQALWSIVKGMSIATLVWATLAFTAQLTGIQGLPRSVPFLYWLLGMALVAGSRFAARWVLWIPIRGRFQGRQVLIYGAGEAGRQLANALSSGHDLFPAGFLDDNRNLHGKDIDSRRVYPPTHLPELIERFGIRDVIVTLPTASSLRRKEVVSYLEQFPVQVRILPALSSIADGRHLVNMVREVDISDLLGRDPVAADPSLLGHCITDKVVLVTGAGGSIGSELSQQIAGLKPKCLILLEASEFSLYRIDQALQTTACDVIPRLGCVEDRQLIHKLLSDFPIDTIYHAAAHKHVPLVEANVIEGARNNIFGTLTLAQAAFEANVQNFVLISTDKAVRPTNIMGATKRWAELIIQDFAIRAKTEGKNQSFCAVRFGNVLGSSGSVIPLFRQQIEQGGPVTVTHIDVTRYFMSVHEAVELVIQASSLGRDGEIFLLDMGEPVKIMDLAKKMIRLAGHTVKSEAHPEGDIAIVTTGLRPGEKLYEELLVGSKGTEGTQHPKIMKASEPFLASQMLNQLLERLQALIEAQDEAAVRNLLMEQVTDSPATKEATPQLKVVS